MQSITITVQHLSTRRRFHVPFNKADDSFIRVINELRDVVC
jgi:hypothetical protein